MQSGLYIVTNGTPWPLWCRSDWWTQYHATQKHNKSVLQARLFFAGNGTSRTTQHNHPPYGVLRRGRVSIRHLFFFFFFLLAISARTIAHVHTPDFLVRALHQWLFRSGAGRGGRWAKCETFRWRLTCPHGRLQGQTAPQLEIVLSGKRRRDAKFVGRIWRISRVHLWLQICGEIQWKKKRRRTTASRLFSGSRHWSEMMHSEWLKEQAVLKLLQEDTAVVCGLHYAMWF